MNEKQSLLIVIGSQTMQIAVLNLQIESLRSEKDALQEQLTSTKPIESQAS